MGSKSEELLEAWGAFFVSHALAIREIESSISDKSPLSLDEYDVLLGISRAPGGRIRYSALASATVFTRSGITRLVRRLEKRGFVERAICPEDKRGAFATLTTKGKNALHDSWKHYSKAIIALLDPCLDKADAMSLKDLLEKIIGQIRNSALVQIGKKSSILDS